MQSGGAGARAQEAYERCGRRVGGVRGRARCCGSVHTRARRRRTRRGPLRARATRPLRARATRPPTRRALCARRCAAAGCAAALRGALRARARRGGGRWRHVGFALAPGGGHVLLALLVLPGDAGAGSEIGGITQAVGGRGGEGGGGCGQRRLRRWRVLVIPTQGVRGRWWRGWWRRAVARLRGAGPPRAGRRRRRGRPPHGLCALGSAARAQGRHGGGARCLLGLATPLERRVERLAVDRLR